MKKTKGSYYTPNTLADLVVRKSLTGSRSKKPIRVLEPSSGDGAFIRALLRRGDAKRFKIDAVEVSTRAINSAASSSGINRHIAYIKNDFLFFSTKQKYDLVIGNPPFIKAKLLSKQQIRECKSIHRKAGLSDRAINNIWTAFILKSISHLTTDGVLALVLPAEILQVNFAKEIQSFLKAHFSRIDIYTFKQIVFPNIGQDTVALVARNGPEASRGIYFSEICNVSQSFGKQSELIRSSVAETAELKWSAHIIAEKEISFLLELCSKIKSVSHYCDSGAGIVTGANRFFIVSKETRDMYDLDKAAIPIIQRGQFVNGSVVFDDRAFREIIKDGKPGYLLNFADRRVRQFSLGERRYIRRGKMDKIAKRFKCKVRDRWYDVPSIWSSEAFFFKRCHIYPKLLKNAADILVTDAAYRIKMKKGFSVNGLVFSFYNSLTLALAELKGRFYGGGVLELTPNEFKCVPLPYQEIAPRDFKQFRTLFDNKKSIDTILKVNDDKILRAGLGLSKRDIKRIQTIRKNLLQRRLRQK